MRQTITTLLEVLGFVLIAVGVGLVLGLGAALIVAGVELVAVGYLEGTP